MDKLRAINLEPLLFTLKNLNVLWPLTCGRGLGEKRLRFYIRDFRPLAALFFLLALGADWLRASFSSLPPSSRLAVAMGFGDLKSPAGLQVLNDYLADKSYIEGYVPSQADVAVFEAVSGPPPADLCHALRWYNHIKSYEKEKASLPGVKKALGKYGPANVEDTTESGATDSKDDDDIDLFGSDDEEESEEAKRLREERLAQYESKKAKKPALVAKSSILLDVKPWDDETDMAKLEECVRSIQADGLVWGSSKLVPVGYGIKKLQIQCVVEDDKVGTDMLEEQITAFDEYVQSMDVAAFNKI